MNLSSFCSNRCGCTSWEVICWSDAPGNKALLYNFVCAAGFHGLDAASASPMMLKSTPMHSKCFVPLSCKHLQLHMANDNKTYQPENHICNPINPTSTNNMKLFLICCLPLFLVFHWPWLLVAKLWETRQVNCVQLLQEHIFVLACVFSVSSRSTSDFPVVNAMETSLTAWKITGRSTWIWILRRH